MSDADPRSRAALLREAFDQGFAQPAALPAPAARGEALLAVRVGPDPYLLPLAALSGVVRDRPLLRLPTAVPAFLGLVGVRAELVPVYGLRALLGYPPADDARGGWLALAREARVGLLFDAYDGQLTAAPEELVPHRAPGAAAALTPRAARVDGVVRPLVDLSATLRLIQQQGPHAAPRE